MSQVIHYTLTPVSRVSAGKAGEVQNNRQIHHVLPGTVVWGALGAAWWGRQGGFSPNSASQADFDRTFHKQVEVGPAIPRLASTDGHGSAIDAIAPAFRPLSWVSCKYPEPGCPPGWRDQMVEVHQGLGGSVTKACPNCRRPWNAAKGWDIPREFATGITRTSLSAGTAVTSQLFIRQALRTATARGHLPIILSGTIRLADDTPEDVVEWLTTSRALRVGGQRSTMGQCEWSGDLEPHPLQLPHSPEGAMAVRLMSPALLLNRYGGASLDLAAALRETIKSVKGKGHVGRTWTRPEVVSGWHGLAGLPKPEEWAVAAGSCALVTDCDEPTIQALHAGVGVRRSEGYGRTVVVPIERANRLIDPDRMTDVDLGLADETTATSVLGSRESLEASVSMTTPSPATPPASLMESLRGHPYRSETLVGLRDAATAIQRLRSRGFPDQVVRARIASTGTRPWMRDLPAEITQKVTALLTEEDLTVLIGRIDQEREGGV